MEKNIKVEQLHFDSEINTVSYSRYPSKYLLHWHQYAECIAIVKPNSKAIVSINQKTMTMNYGDIYFIWPGELHEIIDNTESSIIALQFPMSLIINKKDFATHADLYRDNCFLSYSENPDLNSALLDDFNKIMRISQDDIQHFRNIQMTITLYEMFITLTTELINKGSRRLNTDTSSSSIHDKIELACSYIKTHCEEPISLENVASYVGFSPYYFSRNFKEITTHSFVEYLNLQRINKMQELLTDKTISITDAAYQSGFKSISSLNRIFSRYCGCSPREYRKYYSS